MRFRFSFLLLLLPTLLILIWFREGNLMATGESGIPFYDLGLQYNINKSAWASYTLGHPTNISVAGAPTYYFLSLIQKAGIPSFIIQAAFLWLVLVISGLSIHLLTKHLFPEIESKYLILPVLFYWFNPISLVNVWNRFLNNFLIFYAFIPLTTYLFLKGIKSASYKYAIMIGLISAIFSYSSTSIAFDIIFWLLITYISLFYIVLNKERNKFFIAKFLILTFIFWFLVNFWWIGQVLNYVGTGSFAFVSSTSFTNLSNYNTFYALSRKLGDLVDLFRLKHASFYAETELIKWVAIYQFPLIALFEFISTSVILLPIIIRRKHLEVLFLGSLFLLSIFFTKGNNPPFGEIFNQIFTNFSFIQLFRNPFEKIGFILPLSAAPLFSLGVFLIIKNTGIRRGNVLLFLTLLWLIVGWGYPFWSGLVFTSGNQPTDNPQIGYQVKVPAFYKQASDWLISQGKNFRLIFFPIGGEGITYTWEKGYSGVELSNQLIPLTSVSFSTNIPFFEQVSKNIERLFLAKKEFPRALGILNSKYLVVRSDIDWEARNMRDPQEIENKIETLIAENNQFFKSKQFGQLSFWEYRDWQDKTIYAANRIINSTGQLELDDLMQLGDGSVLSYNNEDGVKNGGLVNSEIIHPSFKYELGGKRTQEDFSFTDDLIFPAIKVLPSDKFYKLLLLKEKIEGILIKNKEELIIRKISLLGKRLMDAEKESEKKNLDGVHTALLIYLDNLQDSVPRLSGLDLKINDKSIKQEELFIIFNKHFDKINKLKRLFPTDKTIELVIKRLKEILIERGIFPSLGYIDTVNFPIKGRKVYQFEVKNSGSYELLLDAKKWEKYFKLSWEDPFLMQVDQNLVFRKTEMKNDYISFGYFYFDKGKHEIAWNTPEEINLIESPAEIGISVGHGLVKKTFDIYDFDPYSSYLLNFDYLINKGGGIYVKVEQNNEKIKENVDPPLTKYLSPDSYNFTGVKHFSEYFIPNSGADSAKLVFRVKPWNNCKDAFQYLKSNICESEEVSARFDLPTDLTISNVSLVKIINESPFLVNKSSPDSSFAVPSISFIKINESEYKVEVKDAKDPFVLVLSQLFDPGWRVYSGNSTQIGKNHFLANTYANGWIINKKGSYDLIIKYHPQELLNVGRTISLITILVGLIFLGTGRLIIKR